MKSHLVSRTGTILSTNQSPYNFCLTFKYISVVCQQHGRKKGRKEEGEADAALRIFLEVFRHRNTPLATPLVPTLSPVVRVQCKSCKSFFTCDGGKTGTSHLNHTCKTADKSSAISSFFEEENSWVSPCSLKGMRRLLASSGVEEIRAHLTLFVTMNS